MNKIKKAILAVGKSILHIVLKIYILVTLPIVIFLAKYFYWTFIDVQKKAWDEINQIIEKYKEE